MKIGLSEAKRIAFEKFKEHEKRRRDFAEQESGVDEGDFMQELKTCPFCGSGAKLHENEDWPDCEKYPTTWYLCGCETEGCPAQADHDCWSHLTGFEAIEAWNARAPDPLREAVLKHFKAVDTFALTMSQAEADLREMVK